MNTQIKSLEELPVMLKVEEVAEVLGISRVLAFNMVKAEDFPAVRIGRRIVIPRDKFLDWLDRKASKSIIRRVEGAE
ncbi:MAG: helix-turn-helix domain-containing protein [Actinobacteria bacterium]|nr:helix-turn-helix domain-containing protein [Actinomycetota bacterium]